MPNYELDRNAAIDWAREVCALPDDGWVLLDTETTGLDIHTSEIIQIGLLSPEGKDGVELMCQLVRPRGIIPEDAIAVHHIGNAEVLDQPTFDMVWPEFMRRIAGKLVVIYNADYDWNLMREHCKRYNLTFPEDQRVVCAMKQYSAFVGEWNYRRQSYRFKSLPAAEGAKAHDAVGDCYSTLVLIRNMAGTLKSGERAATTATVTECAVDDEMLWEL